MTKRNLAFTMAEILLSLTIIGVVAAITLPSLTGNINERTWNTQRKALYARMSQAIALMPALNGYGTLTEKVDENGANVKDENGSNVVDEDTAAETFVTAGLAKVLKINNICDNTHLIDCGIASNLTTLDGESMSFPTTMRELNVGMVGSRSGQFNNVSVINTKAAAFETQNGESIVVYYNPNCAGDLKQSPWAGSEGIYLQGWVCANFVYDLNGNKGPNTVGKDIGFMTVLYPSDAQIVAPDPATKQLTGTYAITASAEGEVSASKACANYDAEYRLPNVNEGIAMFVNKELLKSASTSFTGPYWTSERISDDSGVRGLVVNNSNYVGQIDDQLLSVARPVWCVKR